MKVIVIGATGTIGKEVSSLLKNKGYEVVDASRSSNPSIDIYHPSTIEPFFSAVGPVDAIICAAGGAAMAPAGEQTSEQMQFSANSKLLGQVHVVNKGLAYLRPNGVIVITGGMLAYAPSEKTSLIAMVNAGLEGFARGAALDLKEGRRVVIVHPPWIRETAEKIGMDPKPWPDAATAAYAYLQAIESGKSGEPVFVEGYLP